MHIKQAFCNLRGVFNSFEEQKLIEKEKGEEGFFPKR